MSCVLLSLAIECPHHYADTPLLFSVGKKVRNLDAHSTVRRIDEEFTDYTVRGFLGNRVRLFLSHSGTIPFPVPPPRWGCSDETSKQRPTVRTASWHRGDTTRGCRTASRAVPTRSPSGCRRNPCD